MRHAIVINGKIIQFWIRNCRHCGQIMSVHQGSGARSKCIDCTNKMLNDRNITFYYVINKFFKNKTSKQFIKDWKSGVYVRYTNKLCKAERIRRNNFEVRL